MRSRVEQFERIRLDARGEDMLIRELAASYNVHRRTVRAVLASSTPPLRKPAVKLRTKRVRRRPKHCVAFSEKWSP